MWINWFLKEKEIGMIFLAQSFYLWLVVLCYLLCPLWFCQFTFHVNWGLFWVKKSFKDVKTMKLSPRKCWGTSLAVQVRLHLPPQRAQVQSLVRELRFHMLHSQKAKHKTEAIYCNKFNKDLIKWPTSKKTLKKRENVEVVSQDPGSSSLHHESISIGVPLIGFYSVDQRPDIHFQAAAQEETLLRTQLVQ